MLIRHRHNVLLISYLLSTRVIILLVKTYFEIISQHNTNADVSVSRDLSFKSCGLVFDLGAIYGSDILFLSNEKFKIQ